MCHTGYVLMLIGSPQRDAGDKMLSDMGLTRTVLDKI